MTGTLTLTPRAYQQRAYEAIREQAKQGHTKIVAVGPTAMGKTILACMFINAALALGKSVVFIVHRQEIVKQMRKTLRKLGVRCGVMMSNSPLSDPDAPVQVCSIMTMVAKKKCHACKGHPEIVHACPACKGKGKIRSRVLPEAHLIIADEVHRGNSPSYKEFFAEYPKAHLLGLTATPTRLDGKSLGDLFTSMVIIAEMQELIDQGYLLPLLYYTPYRPDLSKVKIKGGEYDAHSLGEVTSGDVKRIGRIVENWIAKGENQTTLFFGVSVEDSLSVAAEFNKAGITAAHVDANTPDLERKALFEKLDRGEIRVLCNVNIATEGVDIPSLGCVILGRPTKSVTVYLQSVGRGMRIFDGQRYCIVLDHAGCVYEHDLPNEPRLWSLHDQKKKKKGDAPIVSCPNCGMIRPITQQSCPGCGHQKEVTSGLTEVDGELVEYKIDENAERCA